ncbi:MAG TPA: MCE family protein [Mycobacteriales bacterium]|jgi:phospholipid/cholesterol/gamma-HCH transport system substrate-binding protein|nr:MCE family protein [Mycobacteriales bacterium]
MTRRLRGIVVLVGAFLVLTTGCGFHGLYNANLPGSVGGPFSGDKTYTVTVLFDNVLDLVPQSAVKVNDVTVGTVTKIDLEPDRSANRYEAKVVCRVKTSVHLPANAQAILQETSLLGEKFVELRAPSTGATGALHDGSVISNQSSSAYPNVEQVFGVLSAILNGGGLQKLQTISTELSAALAGREDQVRDVLDQLNTFVGGLNVQRDEITRAITGLDKLATDLNAQSGIIATALDDLGPGLRVIADNRAQLVSLLQGLSDLGEVSTRIVNASVDDAHADLAALKPILTQLDEASDALPAALDLLVDFPFSSKSTDAMHGDYTSLYATVDVTGAKDAGLATLLAQVCSTGAALDPTGSLQQNCNLLSGLLTSLPGFGPLTGSSFVTRGSALGDLLAGSAS